MKKNEKITTLITTLLCLLPIILTMYLYNDLPDKIPIHFDANWNADGYAPKIVGGVAFPFFLALLNLFVHFKVYNDSDVNNVARPARVLSLWLIPVLSLVVVPTTLFISLGYEVSLHRIVPTMIAVIFIIFGNYLPKSRPNGVFGIRIPWTMKSENVWKKTHHMAGYLYLAGGVLFILLSWSSYDVVILYVVLSFIMILFPIIYAGILYHKEVS